jgi:hypothetical protein
MITIKKAVLVATMAMTLQRQTYAFDHSMYLRGVSNLHTENSYKKFEELTEAIELFKTLVAPELMGVVPSSAPAGGPDDTKFKRNTP